MFLCMTKQPHAYYAGLLRWLDQQDRYTIASLAERAGLNSSTIRKAINHGSAPSDRTVRGIRGVIGLDQGALESWQSAEASRPADDLNAKVSEKFAALRAPAVRQAVAAVIEAYLAQQEECRSAPPPDDAEEH